MASGVGVFKSLYQSFAELGGPAHGAARVAALRAELAARGLDGFVAPRADEHQNEYVPAAAERLLWLTGFSGSAGQAVVLRDAAAIFVDGRYSVQAPAQVDGAVFAVRHLVDQPPSAWIEANLKPGERLGYDPWLHTPEMVERLSKACRAAGGELVAVDSNPIDAVWSDRPAAPLGPVSAHRARLCGENATGKIARIRAALVTSDGLLVSDAHNVAWLFNIRGTDVAHTPLPLSFAYAAASRPPDAVHRWAQTVRRDARPARPNWPKSTSPTGLSALWRALGAAGVRITFDAATAPARLTQALEAAGGKAILEADPIALMKAVKNAVELAGTRAAHVRDGAALARFLAWFDRRGAEGQADRDRRGRRRWRPSAARPAR